MLPDKYSGTYLTYMVKDLIKTLLYFDVFSYPLKEDELFLYTGINGQQIGLAKLELDKMVRSGLISKHKDFYCFGSSIHIIDRRIKGNQLAIQRMRTARIFTRIIACFPFVEAVMLSGSIAKGYMGRNDDIDFFIVTRPGRLYIARSMLVLFKKLFLANSYRNFCINYFVDSNNLCIREKNRFLATEIAFLYPAYRRGIYEAMIEANVWIKKFYPVFSHESVRTLEASPWSKRLMEKLLNNRAGDRLERFLHERSRLIIRNKFKHMSNDRFSKSFSIEKEVLRYLPGRQQDRIMTRYCWKVRLFERKSGMKLSVPGVFPD